MRILFLSLSLAVFCLGSGITADSAHAQSPHQANATHASPALKTKIADSYGKLLISFEANRGQTNGSVKFLARGSDYGLYLTGQEAVLALHARRPAKTHSSAELRGPARLPAAICAHYEDVNERLYEGFCVFNCGLCKQHSVDA